MKKIFSDKCLCCFVVLLLGFSLLSLECRAEGLTARYLENNNKVSVLEIVVESPPPTSVIVTQHIPSKTRIAKAVPSMTKFSAGRGEVTWLLKAPKPGVQRIRLQYQQPLSGRMATAVIRCKSPRDGQLMTIHVK